MTANPSTDKASPITVELRIDSISRLYNSLDPAPFKEKDLDDAADEYIVGSAEDAGRRPIRLVIVLPQAELARPEASQVADSIRHHFELRRESERRRLRNTWRDGRTSLLVGIAFLAACQLGRNLLADASPTSLSYFVSEGLLIAGWVALWGPLDIFLYGWWPIEGRRRLFDRLSRLDVELRPIT